MFKTILELLLKLGWEVPGWLIALLFILIIIGLVLAFIKKEIIPITHKIIKVKQDLESIAEIKNKQVEIMEKSLEGDETLKKEIDVIRDEVEGLHEKVDKIVDSLEKRWAKEDQAEMSRAQNRLLEMYKKYYFTSTTKTWTKYESEVFFNTLDSYTSHGGNSFILNEVVPSMKLLTVVDE